MRFPSPAALALLLVSGSTMAAQEPARPSPLDCDTVSTGSSLGVVVVVDSTDQGVSLLPVRLAETSCTGVTNTRGRLEFARVPEGEYTIELGTSGYIPQRVAVQVQQGTSLEVEIRVREHDLLSRCRGLGRCAALLEADSTAIAELTEAEQLEEAVWRTTIALAGREADFEWIPCADVQNERVRLALLGRFPLLAPAAACELSAGLSSGSRLIHRPSGSPARRVDVEGVEPTADGAEAVSSYYVEPRWGGRWVCQFVRSEHGWVPRSCRGLAVL